MIISEHAKERVKLGDILQQWPAFDISGLGKDGYDALHIGHLAQPDVALVDENPSFLDCSEIVLALKRWSPKTKVIVLTNSCDNQFVLKAISNGAAGYLLKSKDAEIVPGINWVYKGGSLMSPEIAARAFNMFAKEHLAVNWEQQAPLTRRQLELLIHIGKGLSNKEIAAILQLKNGTIRNYISILLQKMRLRNRTEMAVFAHRSGLIADEKSRKLEISQIK
jgi:DNA-binding NarL/FixJ family response regulator